MLLQELKYILNVYYSCNSPKKKKKKKNNSELMYSILLESWGNKAGVQDTTRKLQVPGSKCFQF